MGLHPVKPKIHLCVAVDHERLDKSKWLLNLAVPALIYLKIHGVVKDGNA